MSRIVFVHTAGIHLPESTKTGTDIAVASLLEEIRGRWPTVSLPVRPRASTFLHRHLLALTTGAPPVIIDKVRGACDPATLLEPGDHVVLADDYAGLLLARGWRPAILIRHNALHHTYPQSPSPTFVSQLQRNYYSWLAKRFDIWSTNLALGVVAPAGTTESLLRRLVPGGNIRAWHPRVPRLASPLPLAEGRARRGLFFGNFAYAPNREALLLLCSEIAPKGLESGISYRVCGPGARASLSGVAVPANVEVSDFVPDLVGVAAECDFGVIPILRGEGILLKTLTMMGFGLPIVATPLSSAGTGLVHGHSALIADSAEGMRAQIERLDDPALRRSLGQAAWQGAARFSESSGIVTALEDILGPSLEE